jgi:sucrose-6-phosphate hydrolase SacC (GH32 family)
MDNKPAVQLHYSPPTGIFGDPIPFFWNGTYHIYFQNSPGEFSFEKMRWAHITSKDLFHWEPLPDAIIPEPESPDAFGCWTGSIIHWKNIFHIFYTGCSEPGGGNQTICHATSLDLIQWKKDNRNPILSPFLPFSTESKSAWRDPCVIQDADGFRMLITAEMSGKPKAFSGCIIEFHSVDLFNWEFIRVLYMPLDTNKMECPDLFPMEDRWLLLYSDSGVEVRWSENGINHWEKTNPYRMDNYRFYAAKTLLDDQNRRLCFGFISDRVDRYDSSPWKWGGILSFPRNLFLREKDRLQVSPIKEFENLRKYPLPIEIIESQYSTGRWQFEGKNILGYTSTDAQTGITVLIGKHPETWNVSFQLDLADSASNSLLFNCQRDYSSGYCLEINREQSLLVLKRLFPASVSDSLVLQEFKLPNQIDRNIRVNVVFDCTVIEVYINEEYCFSARVYPQESKGNWWGFYSKTDSFNGRNIEAWYLSL